MTATNTRSTFDWEAAAGNARRRADELFGGVKLAEARVQNGGSYFMPPSVGRAGKPSGIDWEAAALDSRRLVDLFFDGLAEQSA